MDERFIRTEQLLGSKALEKLNKATVAVFGLGAVGSFAVEALARAGVGRLILIDFDRVKKSNFNRQLYALESNLERLKVDIARERILQINPHCEVTTYAEFAGEENFHRLLAGPVDLVLDAIDSLNPKTGLIAYCVHQAIPIVSSMGAGEKTDPESVRIGDLSEVKVCALARHLKKRLRKRDVRTGVRCIYSTQKSIKSKPLSLGDHDVTHRGRKRNTVGTFVYMTGIFGLIAASEVIKMMTKQSK